MPPINAGHVYGTINNLDSTRSQIFTYDSLNRITGALTTSTYATSPTHCWGETYQFDGVTNGAWGNLTQIAATTNSAYTGCSQESGFATTADGNNHIGGFAYDAAGNTTQDGTHYYQFNAEGELSWTYNLTYSYDGDARRVAKVGSNYPKLYWYGAGGEILSETNPAGNLINDYVFFGGKRVAAAPNDLNLNGGFEQGLTNWAVTGAGTATAVNIPANAHSGNYYAEITAPAGYTTTTLSTTQPISSQIGETVTAAGWVYHESDSTGYTRWWLTVQGSNGGCITGQLANNNTMNTWIYQTVSLYIPTWCTGPFTATVFARAESDSNSASGRFDDVTLNGNLTLFAEDMLGTSRIVTDNNGVVCYGGDFYPYGGERPYTNTCDPVYKFEGKERDLETGNDDFGARYYSNRFGRWLSADWSAVPVAVPYANLTNPQTLNLYSMVADDPESFADLDGHYRCQGSAQECQAFKQALGIVRAADANLEQGSKERTQLDAVLKFYGKDDGKGPTIKFADLHGDAVGETATVNGKTTITFDPAAVNAYGKAGKGETIAHEGMHGVDDHKRGVGAGQFWMFYDTEYHAYRSESYVDKGLGKPNESDHYKVWKPGMSEAEQTRNIKRNAYENAYATLDIQFSERSKQKTSSVLPRWTPAETDLGLIG